MAIQVGVCDAARRAAEHLLHLALLHRLAGWSDICELEQILSSEVVPSGELRAILLRLDPAVDALASSTEAGKVYLVKLEDLVAEMEKPAELDETAARFERALRAIAACKLTGVDRRLRPGAV